MPVRGDSVRQAQPVRRQRTSAVRRRCLAAPEVGADAGFDGLWLANGAAVTLDMSDRFEGEGLSFEALVTTTHKRTGAVRTKAINTVVRNKVRGCGQATS